MASLALGKGRQRDGRCRLGYADAASLPSRFSVMSSDPEQQAVGLTYAEMGLQAAVLAYVIDSAPNDA